MLFIHQRARNPIWWSKIARDDGEEGLFDDPFKDFTLEGSESHWAVLGNILFLWIEPVGRYEFGEGFRIESALVDKRTAALAIKQTFYNLQSFATMGSGQAVGYLHGCESTFNASGWKSSTKEAWKAVFPVFWRIASETGNFVGVLFTTSHVVMSILFFLTTKNFKVIQLTIITRRIDFDQEPL